jgi:hypothetical protein
MNAAAQLVKNLSVRDRAALRSGQPTRALLAGISESIAPWSIPVAHVSMVGQLWTWIVRPGDLLLPMSLAQLTQRERTTSRVEPRVRRLLGLCNPEPDQERVDAFIKLIRLAPDGLAPVPLAKTFIAWHQDEPRQFFALMYYDNAWEG